MLKVFRKIQDFLLYKRALFSVFFLLLICCLSFILANSVNAATEFVSIIDPDNADGTDYTSLYSWEENIQADLTSSDTLVFSYSTASGTIPDAYTVLGETSGAIASSTHMSTSTTGSQIMLTNIVGTFQSGETVYIQGMATSATYVILADAGDSVIAVANCRSSAGTADTAIVTIDGWTTSASNYIKIWTNPDDNYRHNGKWNDAKYRLVAGTGSENTIGIYENYVRIDGLQIESSITDYYGAVVVHSLSAGNQYEFSNNIIRRMIGDTHGSSNWISGINLYPGGSNNNVKIWNNIIYGYSWGINARGNSVIISNVTIDNCYGRGIQSDNTGNPVLVTNSIVQNTPDAFTTNNGGSFDSASDYNITDVNGDAPNATFTTSALTVNFNDIINDDYHLSRNDTVALNAGTSSVFWYTDLPVQHDIDGTARGGAIDIGADELPVQFVSTICENTSAGGDCATDMDYNSLVTWEDNVESNLTLNTTRVFSGSITGILSENSTVNLCDGATDTGIDGVVVATTTDQILIDGITGTTSPLIAVNSYVWNDDACGTTNNYWTISGSGDDLGASPMAVAKIDGEWLASSSQVYINDWTTDYDNQIKIYTTDIARHKGTWDEKAYRIEVNNTYGLRTREANIIIDGLQVFLDEANDDKAIDLESIYSVGNIYVSNNILRGDPDNTNYWNSAIAFYGVHADTIGYVWNNIIYDFRAAGNTGGIQNVSGPAKELHIFNNTFYNCRMGLYTTANAVYDVINNIFKECVIDMYFSSGDMASTSRNNIGDDYEDMAGGEIITRSTADGTSANKLIDSVNSFQGNIEVGMVVENTTDSTYTYVTAIDSDTQLSLNDNIIISGEDYVIYRNYILDVDFVSTTTYNFHLTEDSLAVNLGSNLTASTSLIINDVDSSARNVDLLGWDIGADEVGTKMYRSVGNDTTDLSNNATVTISGRTATFSVAQPNNIGVGDVIQYGNSGSYQLAFITARASSTEYSVQSATGTAPMATTTASMEIFRAYTRLYDWEPQVYSSVNSAIDSTVDDFVVIGTDLVSSGTIMIVPCYESINDSDYQTIIQGWDTGAGNYITIYTPTKTDEVGISQRHSGKWGDGFRINSIGNGDVILIREPYVNIDGISIRNNSGRGIFINQADDGEVNISNNFVWLYEAYSSDVYDVWDVGDMVIRLWNNIAYNERLSNGAQGFNLNDNSSTYYLYNNTSITTGGNAMYGISGSSVYAVNNIAYSKNEYDFSGSFASFDNNISFDTTANRSGSGNKYNQSVKFVDVLNADFHLATDDTSAMNAGTSSPLDSIASLQNDIVYDIDGNYRRSWDVGADEASIEYVASVVEDGTGDFTTLNLWEEGLDCDIFATTTAVFTATTSIGQFQSYELSTRVFTGQTSGASGQLIHIATSTSEVEQILLVNIIGDFEVGEVVSDGYGTTTLENLGDPVIAVAKIDGTWDNPEDYTYINGTDWVTGPNNYIKIYTTETARHNGKWDDTKYRFVSTGQWSSAFYAAVRYVHVDGIQAYGAYNSSGGTNNAVTATRRGFEISNSIMKSIMKSSGAGVQIDAMEDFGSAKIWNNIMYDFVSLGVAGAGVYADYSGFGQTIWVYNNTIYNTYEGVRITGEPTYASVYLYNNLVQNTTNSAYVFGNIANVYSYNNLSGDSTAGTKSGENCITNATVKFADEVARDLHLSQDDISARDAGANLFASSTFVFTTDIDGTTRGASVDIGADELPVQFVSTICEGTSAGGDCSEMDYSILADWEDAIESDLTATSTRVFGGTSVGSLIKNDIVYLFDTSNTSVARGTVVATTSDQILIDNIIASTTLPVYATTTGYVWRLDGSNYWTVNGNGDDLGASAMAVAKIDGEWGSPDTEFIVITYDTWETDIDNSIKIYTTKTARHKGKWTDTAYRLQPTLTSDNQLLYLRDNVMWVDGLQFYNTSTSYFGRGILVSNQDSLKSNIKISNNIIRGASYTGRGISMGDSTNAEIWNNIIYNAADTVGDGIAIGDNSKLYIHNNTIINSHRGVYVSSTDAPDTILRNNISVGNSDWDFHSKDYNPASNNNISSDSSASQTTLLNGITGIDMDDLFVRTTSGSEDFHITDDAVAVNAGFNISASTSFFTIDIDGSERNVDGLSWDIGADEVATKMYRSVGNDSSDLSNTATVTISGRTATFSVAQPDNIGVGDVIQYGNAGNYKLAFITARASSTEYSVQSATGTAPIATTTANMEIYRAFLELDDWEDHNENSVNSGIDSSVDELVLIGQDLVSSGTIMMVPCYASDNGDSAGVIINGWDTSGQNYIYIYTPVTSDEVGVSQRHEGKWSTEKYYLNVSNTSAITMQERFVQVIGLQVIVNSTNADSQQAFKVENTTGIDGAITILFNIIRGYEDNTYSYHRGISEWNFGAGDGLLAYGNIIYDFRGGTRSLGIVSGTSNGSDFPVFAYNNTIYNCDYGLRDHSNNSMIAVNNLVNNCTDPYYGTFLAGSSYNLSSDGDAPGADPILNTDVDFIDVVNDDFHLSPDDTSAVDAGLNIPTTSFMNYDIDGNYRRSWDVGADEASMEYVASVMEDGNGHFTTLSAWEDGIECDLVATTTAVFDTISLSGTFQAYEISNRLFVGQTSGATAQLVHASSSILFMNIEGDFEIAEIISDGYGTTSVSNLGNPVIAVAKIDGTWDGPDTTATDIAGWTTGPNNYVRIYTTDLARHNGKNTGYNYRINPAISSNGVVINEAYTRVDGLEIFDFGGLGYGAVGILIRENYGVISNNIIHDDFTGNNGIGISAGNTSGYHTFYNNIVYNVESRGLDQNYWPIKESYWYNNTVYNSDIGIHTPNREAVLVNNISQNCTYDYYGSANSDSTNNISSDGTVFGSNSFSSTTVSFVDISAGDFHLSYDDTSARDLGTSTIFTDSNLNFLTDVDGTARGISVDIGADELPVQFISTICENSSAGGDCSDMDYSSLATWEAAVESDLSLNTTRVYTGSSTGTIVGNANLNLCNGVIDTGTNAIVVATTTGQLLVDGITGTTSLLTIEDGYSWENGTCGSASNYWTISGSGDDLGASAMVVARIDGVWSNPDINVNISGWVTDQDNSIKVYTTDTARHHGKWSNTDYRIEIADSYGFGVRVGYIEVSGLQIYITSGGSSNNSSFYIPYLSDGWDITLNENILRGSETGAMWHMGVEMFSNSEYGHSNIYNNIIYDFQSSVTGAGIYIEDGLGYVYNNTIYNCDYGIYSQGNGIQAINNIVASTTDPFRNTFLSGTANNATDHVSDSPTGGTNTINSVNFDFISTASGTEDLHIGINSGAKDLGLDLSATSTMSFSTDIDGTTRPFGVSWDIGADEYTKYVIYRSMGYGNTLSLQCGGGSNNLNVSSSTASATFDSALIDEIGVGDAIVYNASSSIIFITGRTDSTHYSVQTVAGANPSDITNDADWCIYRAYTTLARAENGIENTGIPSAVRNFDDWTAGGTAGSSDLGRDMVTNKEQWNFACYADGKNVGETNISGWTSSDEYSLKIYTPFSESEVGISQRHGGRWDDNKFVVASDSTIIYAVIDNVYIEGIQFDKTGSDGYGAIMTNGPYYQKGLFVYNNIIRCTDTCKDSEDQYGINFAWIAGVAEVKNNIIYGFTNSGGAAGIRLAGVYAGANQDYLQSVIANNTIYGNYYGIRIYGTGGNLYNNLSIKNEIDYVIEDPLIDSGNNISSDSTSPDAGFTYQSVLFVDEVNYDLHLSPDDTTAIDNGTSTLETNPYLSFTDDIDGNYRRTWDIGADEASIEFESTVMESGGDFSSLYTWEESVQNDLKATTTAVFSCSSATGTFPIGATVIGTSTGTLASSTLISTSSSQALLYNISGDFEVGEKVYIQGASTSTNYCVLADNGNPVIATAKIDGVWTNAETNDIDIDGWETGENNYIKIYTSDEARHKGKWSDEKYRLIGSSDLYFRISEEYVVVDGLQFKQTGNDDRSIVIGAHDGKNTIANSIIVGNVEDPSYLIDSQANNEMSLFIFNNIFYDGYAMMMRTWDTESYTAYIFNNTIYNCTAGIAGSIVNDIVINNLIASTTEPFNLGFHASSTNNATDDSSTPSGGSNTFNNLSFDFDKTIHGSENLHIGENSGALNIATSTDWIPVFGGIKKEYDYDGTARGGAYDIGADELPVEFESIICENISAGGDCADLDYHTLLDWEGTVDSALSLETTRVFVGSITGSLNSGATVNLCNGATDTGIDGYVVATTSDQILIRGIMNSVGPLVTTAGYIWSDEACASMANYWTVSGSGDDLGASARAVAKIDGSWSTANTDYVMIAGWITDQDNSVKIYTTELARHNGEWDDSKYRIEFTMPGSYYATIYAQEDYITIDGLQFELNSNGYPDVLGISTQGLEINNEIIVSNNIFKGVIDTYSYGAVNVDDSDSNVSVYNNIFYDFTGPSGSHAIRSYGHDVKVYNNTFHNNDYGIRILSGDLIAINNIISSTTNAFEGTFATGTMYNATDDTDTPDGGTNTINNASFDFFSTTVGAEDFHIDENSDAINAGVDLSATTTLSFTTDIDGGIRSLDDAGWDLGADERATKIYRSVGNTSSALSTGDTVTISGSTATFSDDQPSNVGVGDVIQYGNAGSYSLVFITGRTSATVYSVQAYDGGVPTATTTASAEIYRAYLELNDWEDQLVDQVNNGIDDTVDDLVLVSQNLVASDTIMMVPCYASDDGDNAPVNIDGWETGERNYIKIYTPVTSDEVGISQRHNGKWDDNKYYIYNDYDESGFYQATIYIAENYVTVDGLQLAIACVHQQAIRYSIPEYGANNSIISNNIIKNIGSENESGIYVGAYWCQLYIYNNVFYDFTGGTGINRIDGYAHTYNNTFYNCATAMYSGEYRRPNIYNNIAQNCLGNCFNGDFGSESDYNLSEDGTAPGANSITTTTVKFVDEDNDDFHLSPEDTVAIDAGISTPFDSRTVIQDGIYYDIDGNYRRSRDLGADEASIEYVASVMADGTGDFSTLSAWEDEIESDIVATTTAVFTATTSVGQFQSYELSTRLFIGQISGATGQLIHIATSTSDVEQILLAGISGDFEIGEEIGDGYGTTTLQNLGNPVIATAKIDGLWSSADTQAVSINGWDTGARNYVRVYTTETARHKGTWGDGYRMEISGGQQVLEIREDYVRVDGLSIKSDTRSIFVYGLDVNGETQISNCFGWYTGNIGFDVYDIYAVGDVIVKMWNNIGISDSSHTGSEVFFLNDDSSTFYIYNNTGIANGGRAFRGAFIGKLTNNLGISKSNGAYSIWGADVQNCLSDDDTADDYGGTGNIINATVQFKNEYGDDYHLADTDTAAKNKGVSLIDNATTTFWSDIDGTARGGAWDIGADELPVQFVSTVCENSLAGGDCDEIDYYSLLTWEDAVEADLTASSTRVFGGTITGSLNENDVVYFFDETGTSTARGEIVATTSDQILIDNIISSSSVPVVSSQNYVWRLDGSNYWTVTGSGDDLGASPIAVAKIDGIWTNEEDSTPGVGTTLFIDAWDTDLDNRIKIYTVGVARHKGVWDDTKYRIVKTTNHSYARAIMVREENVDIDGLQIGVNADTYTQIEGIQIGTDAGEIVDYNFSNNIITQLSGSTIYTMGIGGDAGDTPTGEVRIYNNIIYGFRGWGIVNYVDGDYYIYNNTIYDTGTGISAYRGSTVAKNNLIASTTNPFNNLNFAAGTDYNSIDINDTPGVGSHNLTNQTFSFVSTTTEDFHLSSDDSGAKSKGINLQFDENLSFNTDIDDETRHVVWDIGADHQSGGNQSINANQDDLSLGLVGHWNFNEGYGDTVNDLSGNGNDGTWGGNGTHWTGYGKFGNSGIFDEDQTDYVDVGSGDSLDNLADFTYSAWVYATPEVGNYSPIIEKGNGSADRKHLQYQTSVGSSERQITALVDCDTTDAVVRSVKETYSLNVWEHLVLTFSNATKELHMYLNGVEVDYVTFTPGVGDYVDDSDDEMWFGATPATSFAKFDGKIDEVRVYDRVITNKEIATLYNEGKALVDWNFKNNYNDTGSLCNSDSDKCRNLIAGGIGNEFGGGYLEESTTALNLDGTGYAYIADNSYFDMATDTDCTIVATVKTTSDYNMMIISKKASIDTADVGYTLGIDNGAGDGIVYFSASDGVQQYELESNIAINDGKWHTITVVFDNINETKNKIYIDGKNQTGTISGALANIDNLSNSEDVYIGRSGDDANYFIGSIDRVALFAYAFDKEDVLRENSAGFSMRIGHLEQDNTKNSDWDPFGGAAPLAWWKLDEFDGGTAYDYASTTLNGVWNGSGTHQVNGKIGMGGDFNGIDDYVYINNLNLSGDFTFTTWVNVTLEDNDNYISADVTAQYLWHIEQSGQVHFFNGTTWTPSTDAITANEWHYLSCTGDGSTISLYVDGVLSTSSAMSNFGSINGIFIGQRENFWYFDGQIDDYKIYDYARTAGQIAWDYNQGKPLVHLKFDEATSGSADGEVLIDSIGNFNGTGDDGTNNTGLDWITGKWGSAIDFDDSDDLVNLGSDDSLDNLAEMTVCSWIKQESCGGNYGTFVGKTGSGVYGWNFYTRCIDTGGFGFSLWDITDSGIWRDNRNFTIETDTWYHVCASYDGSGSPAGIKLYANGRYVGYTNQRTDVSFIQDDASYNLTVGRAGGYSFGGLIDDVRIYNYIRTDDQIKEDYNGARLKFE